MLVLGEVSARFNCIALTANEVVEATRQIAGLGLVGGIIYDALLMACARKANAELIYTWNKRHFKRVAPDMAERIVAP
jgi:predicted nucleic acid-binding protein